MEYLFTEILDGRNESLTDDVNKVLGREPGTFAEYVNKAKKTGVWHMLTKEEDYKGFKGQPLQAASRTYWPQPISPLT